MFTPSFRTLLGPTLTTLLIGCTTAGGTGADSSNSATHGSIAPQFTLEKNGRDFDRLSIHPNSEEWLFTECSRELNPAGDCSLLRYNINTKQLQRYDLPDGYLYGYASFSPQGNYVLMSRSPKHDGSEEKVRQSLQNGEIVMMRSDGTDFKVLAIPKGRNLAPFMSKDETKIAYWQISSKPLPSGGRGWGDFDVREYDLKTKQDALFAGPFHFVGGGNSQYLSENEIIINSYGPEKYAQSMGDYHKKFNGSEVYKLKRGAIDIPEPSFVDVEHAHSTSVDKAGNIYLDGQKMPGVGSSLFRKTPSGEITYWQRPHLGALRHVIAALNGEYIAFIYSAEGTQWADRKSAMGVLDTIHSKWLPVAIPQLRSSTPVIVKAAAE
jgi:hypothetical protein